MQRFHLIFSALHIWTKISPKILLPDHKLSPQTSGRGRNIISIIPRRAGRRSPAWSIYPSMATRTSPLAQPREAESRYTSHDDADNIDSSIIHLQMRPNRWRLLCSFSIFFSSISLKKSNRGFSSSFIRSSRRRISSQATLFPVSPPCCEFTLNIEIKWKISIFPHRVSVRFVWSR